MQRTVTIGTTEYDIELPPIADRHLLFDEVQHALSRKSTSRWQVVSTAALGLCVPRLKAFARSRGVEHRGDLVEYGKELHSLLLDPEQVADATPSQLTTAAVVCVRMVQEWCYEFYKKLAEAKAANFSKPPPESVGGDSSKLSENGGSTQDG